MQRETSLGSHGAQAVAEHRHSHAASASGAGSGSGGGGGSSSLMNGDLSRSAPAVRQQLLDGAETSMSSSVGCLPKFLQAPEINICEMGSLEDLEIGLEDLEGLEEVCVDSEPEDCDDTSDVSSQYSDTFAPIFDMLSRPPEKRSSEDLEVVLEFVQHMPAFANMTLPVREKLCGLMRLQTHAEQHSVLVRSGEEVDSWWVVFGGSVELIREGYEPTVYHLGEAFGVSRSQKKKLMLSGMLLTRSADTTLLSVPANQFHDVLAQSEQATVEVVEDGQVVLVTELRKVSKSEWAHVVVRGSESKLVSHLVSSEYDVSYAEDFLLGYRTFMSAIELAELLEQLFANPELRDKIARTVLLWVNNHINDFNSQPEMIAFLRAFRHHLQEASLLGEVRLLSIAVQRRASFVLVENGNDMDTVSMRGNSFDSGLSSSSGSLSQVSENSSPKPSLFSRRLPGLGSKRPASSSSSRQINTRQSGPSPQRRDSHGSVVYSPPATSTATISVSPTPPSSEPTLPSNRLPFSVVKLYRHDHQFRYITVTPETTALELVQLGVSKFEMPEGDENYYSLCRITVDAGPADQHIVKQTVLPDRLGNLPSQLRPSSRFYLKPNSTTANLVHGNLVSEMIQEGATDLLSLEPKDVARVVTLKSFLAFSSITSSEYISDIWDLPSSNGASSNGTSSNGDRSTGKEDTDLQRFSKTTNNEMFWVVTEIVSEPSQSARVRKIKFFLKVAKYCRALRNFNTAFAITSGLSYGAVTRLRQTWEKLGGREIKASKWDCSFLFSWRRACLLALVLVVVLFQFSMGAKYCLGIGRTCVRIRTV